MKSGKEPDGKDRKERGTPRCVVALIAILVTTVLVYHECPSNGILNFDDNEYFQNYPEIVNLSPQNVLKYFTRHYVLMYQPLPVLSYAVNYHFTGLNPAPLHRVNLLLHLCAVVLVFLVFRGLGGNPGIALIIAALFAIHPLNVEATAWMSARSSGMYAVFYLSATLAYLRRRIDPKSRLPLPGALLFFLLSLLSKAQAVTLPLVLLLLDYFKTRRITRRDLIEKIPFFLLSVVFGIVTVAERGTLDNITRGMMISYTMIDSVFLVSYTVMFYLAKLLVPAGLCAIYVYPPKVNGFLPVLYYVSLPALVALAGAFVRWGRRSAVVVFGVSFFMITVLPNIQIIPSRCFIAADRYLYLPALGLFFVFASGLAALGRRSRTGSVTIAVVVAAVIGALGLVSSRRVKDWKDNEGFMRDIIAKNAEVPYLSRAYGALGSEFFNRGLHEKAVHNFAEAVRLNPSDGLSYCGRGISLNALGRYGEALVDLDTAVRLMPALVIAYVNRAVVKTSLRDFSGALDDCGTAVSLDSANAYAYNVRGAVLVNSGRLEEGLSEYDRALRLDPRLGEAWRNRGSTVAQLNRMDRACNDWKSAAALGDGQARSLVSAYCE